MATINCGTFYGNAPASGRFRAEIVLTAEDTGTGYKIYRVARIYVLKASSQFTSNMRVSWSSEVSTPIKCGTTGNYYGTSPTKLVGTYAYGQTVSVSEYCYYYATSGSTYRSDVTASYTIPYPTYTISYNANGGTGAPGNQTKKYGTNITLSSAKPTREAYLFQGWNTNRASTTSQYDSGATYSANASATLYAIWKEGYYDITYNANGGTLPASITKQRKEHNGTINLHTAIPTRTDYQFMGWGTNTTTVSYQPGDAYSTNANLTLYAIWRKNTFTITYNGNGATSGATASTKKPEAFGSVYVSKNGFSKTGYSFSGWNTSPNGDGTWYYENSSYTANADVTLYAQWLYRGSSITIDAYRVLTENSKRKHPGGRYIYIKIKYSYAVQPNYGMRSLIYGDSGDSSIPPITVNFGESSAMTGEYETWTPADYDPETKYALWFKLHDEDGFDSNIVNINIPKDNEYFFRFFGIEKFLKTVFSLELEKLVLTFGNSTGKIYSKTADGGEKEVLNGCNNNGETSFGWGNYNEGEGLTVIYGADVQIGVNHGGAKKTFVPYHYPGQVFPYGTLDTVGYVTNGGYDVHFTMPLSLPMVNVLSISVSGKFYIRQNNAYAYGGSASSTVEASNIACYKCGGGVRVVATFPNTTGITNNSPCGVTMVSPVITFE